MATFIRKGTKQMDPRPGVKYATEYTQLNPAQRRKLKKHIESVMKMTLEAALTTNDYSVLQPLKGFPRTNGDNYSAADIISDLNTQIDSGKDVPSGMLGRWNRLFEDFPEEQIDFSDEEGPSNNFGSLFK